MVFYTALVFHFITGGANGRARVAFSCQFCTYLKNIQLKIYDFVL